MSIKYINSDLNQAKSLQYVALNNILANIEKEKLTTFEIYYSIGLDSIQEAIVYRYITYRKTIDKISINYEFKINNSMYTLKVSHTNGHITILKN